MLVDDRFNRLEALWLEMWAMALSTGCTMDQASMSADKGVEDFKKRLQSSLFDEEAQALKH